MTPFEIEDHPPKELQQSRYYSNEAKFLQVAACAAYDDGEHRWSPLDSTTLDASVRVPESMLIAGRATGSVQDRERTLRDALIRLGSGWKDDSGHRHFPATKACYLTLTWAFEPGDAEARARETAQQSARETAARDAAEKERRQAEQAAADRRRQRMSAVIDDCGKLRPASCNLNDLTDRENRECQVRCRSAAYAAFRSRMTDAFVDCVHGPAGVDAKPKRNRLDYCNFDVPEGTPIAAQDVEEERKTCRAQCKEERAHPSASSGGPSRLLSVGPAPGTRADCESGCRQICARAGSDEATRTCYSQCSPQCATLPIRE